MDQEVGGMIERTKKSRRLTVIVVLFVVALLVLGAIFSLQLIYLVMSFWTNVTFENASGEDIRITPIGITDGTREIGPIFSYKRPFFFVPVQNTRFRLDDGESLNLTYNWDDQNLQFIIVEYGNDDVRIVKIDEYEWRGHSYRGCCSPTEEDMYTIPHRTELPPCPEVLRPTIDGDFLKVTDELIGVLMQI